MNKAPGDQGNSEDEEDSDDEEEFNIDFSDEKAELQFDHCMAELKFHIKIVNKITLCTRGDTEDKGKPLLDTDQRKAVRTLLATIGFLEVGTTIQKKAECRKRMEDEIVMSGVITAMCNIILKTDENGYYDDQREIIKRLYAPLLNSLKCVEACSDTNEAMSVEISKVPGFLELVVSMLNDLHGSHMAGTLTDDEDVGLGALLLIVFNLSVKDNTDILNRLREVNTTEICIRYLKPLGDTYGLLAIATLAEIVSEKECDVLNADTTSISDLISGLQENDTEYVLSGWNSVRRCRILRRLARNDCNKRNIVKLGSLPVLKDLCQSTAIYPGEPIEATNTIWMLSFDDDNKNDIIKCEGLVDLLHDMQKSDNIEIKKACNGTLWTLRELLRSNPKYDAYVQHYFQEESSTNKVQHNFAEGTPIQKGHVMISYHWDNQELLRKIKEQLKKNNYPVWIDVDDMTGNTRDAMASAVENADVVIVCMTQKYKDSANCRLEAEYASKKNKKIVPCIMERGYEPDGWLGLMLGPTLYFDFSGKYKYEDKLQELLKEISVAYGGR